jgi:hypothetical protein
MWILPAVGAVGQRHLGEVSVARLIDGLDPGSLRDRDDRDRF